MAIMLAVAIGVPIVWAQSENTQLPTKAPSNSTEKQLTEAQKKQLADLYSKIAELKKQIVDKYLEFGIIDKDRAQLIKQKINQIEKFRAEKGYLPGFGDSKSHGGFKSKKSKGLDRKCPFTQ